MGCGASLTPEQQEQRSRSQDIEKELRRDAKDRQEAVKLLLLGSGASGKSTIVKQMRVLYLDGFSDKETIILKEIVFFNILKNMKQLVTQARKWDIPVAESNQSMASELHNMTLQLTDVELTQERSMGIRNLWGDPGIQQVVARASEFQLEDSAPYFFSELERISADGYIPSTKDILFCRAKTTGIVETDFLLENREFTVVDVGGQRNERKKWIHAFDDVTAIIFVVGTSEYDQVLEEDLVTNRMKESLQLFDSTINSKYFKDTSVILFLNKKDLFAEKIKRVSLKKCFPEFSGPDGEYEAGMEFIKKSFYALDRSTSQRPLYSHETCATDTSNIEVVLSSVTSIFLEDNLKDGGIF